MHRTEEETKKVVKISFPSLSGINLLLSCILFPLVYDIYFPRDILRTTFKQKS